MKKTIILILFILFIPLVLSAKQFISIDCTNDAQCENGFCDLKTKKCTQGLNFDISSTKTILNINDESKISLSVVNPTAQDIYADITLTFGNGLKLIDVLLADQCLGNKCKLDRQIIPSGGKKDIVLDIESVSSTDSFVKAYLKYNINKKDIEIEDILNLKIVECGNGVLESGETSNTCCEDALCPEDSFFYGNNCNRKTHSCEKKLKGIVYLIFFLLLIIVIIPIIKPIIKFIHKIFKDYIYGRSGKPWRRKEKSQLKYNFLKGKSIKQIAKIHKRDPDAIMHRLINDRLVGFVHSIKKYKKHGMKWSLTEENTLKKQYNKNKDILRLAKLLQREPNAILHRLVEVGLVDDKEIMKYKRRK